MGKDKARRFAENLTFKCLIQPEFEEVFRQDYPLKGQWRKEVFGNDNPVILELGCGRGEYTVELARKYPNVNFIGVDIKGARMWRGAKSATEESLGNVAFLRTRIEFINSLFAENEIDGLWITFPDPQLKKNRVKKRLTSPIFLANYAKFLKPDASINLKTDCKHLHDYTTAVIEQNDLPFHEKNSDIYGTAYATELLSIKTAYEQQYLAKGIAITYLRFSLGDKTEFIAPEFEPDDLLA
ncbi:MAG: tRNA (guanosine(46)-N7)-methyltransferase TrmB [Rikenellaceae bacterium]